MRMVAMALAATLLSGGGLAAESPARPALDLQAIEADLVRSHGEAERARIKLGLAQAAALWRATDGDAKAFADVAAKGFTSDPAVREALFERLERLLESLDGHMVEIGRDFRRQSDLDLGPIHPFDDILAGYDPSAHVTDDLFENRLAYTVLLNFPKSSLKERLEKGDGWSRRQWAEARLVDRFSRRVPAEVNQAIAKAAAEGARYIAEYNIWMHHLVDEKGERVFPPKLRLLSHWNLRDELKASYADAKTGLAKQRTIQKVMERIVTQSIPGTVVNNPNVDWNPVTNAVTTAAVSDTGSPAPRGLKIVNDPEPDTRYAMLRQCFLAVRQADPYSPAAPTFLARRFDEDRQIPEARFRAMLEEVLSSPLAKDVGKVIEKRLGRKLEPFDIWYDGFRPRGKYAEAELDAITKKRYPTAEAYAKGMPELLTGLGFSAEKAAFLASKIEVDPARGSGHALGAGRREDKSHLRTRVEKDGMNYKGFNIAVHEMGHNVEQVFSLNTIDHTLLAGVPNTAFTEALAFVFQARDLELLGLAKPDERTEALETLNDFWGTFEISGVALVDMGVWHYLYDHPDATPKELREATIGIAKDVWNRFYAPVFGTRDVVLLGIYSHMIDSFLYLPDYPLGHMIAFQVRRQMQKAGNLAQEFERVARIGNVAPDLWMKTATGSPVGSSALLQAAAEALPKISK